MKPSIFYSHWNPFENSKLDFAKTVSISIDTMEMDENSEYKILILYVTEPEPILSNLKVDFNILKKFDKIYTHNSNILKNFKNSELVLFGSCWIDFTTYTPNKKNRLSFVSSSKKFADGHLLRHNIYDYFNSVESINGIEIYQHKSPPYHNRRNDFFETFKFHVSVENCKESNYFSEKLIDCFATKTIPIYWGCPNIGDYFNNDGIFTFNSLDELKTILDMIDSSFYENNQHIIEENYEKSKKYWNFYERINKYIETFMKNNSK